MKIMQQVLVVMTMAVVFATMPATSAHYPMSPEARQCWKPLLDVNDKGRPYECSFQVYDAVFHGKKIYVDAACCPAVLQVSDRCWGLMFGWINSIAPKLLKDYCIRNTHLNGDGFAAAPVVPKPLV